MPGSISEVENQKEMNKSDKNKNNPQDQVMNDMKKYMDNNNSMSGKSGYQQTRQQPMSHSYDTENLQNTNMDKSNVRAVNNKSNTKGNVGNVQKLPRDKF